MLEVSPIMQEIFRIMQVTCLMLSSPYYAEYYTSIIDAVLILVAMAFCMCKIVEAHCFKVTISVQTNRTWKFPTFQILVSIASKYDNVEYLAICKNYWNSIPWVKSNRHTD